MIWRCLFVLLCFTIPSCPAWAHGKIGKRVFLEPLTAEDANVKNELDLPRFELLPQPDGVAQDFSYSLEKEIYPHLFSISLGQDHLSLPSSTGPMAGWDNLQLGLKWQAYTNVPHEFALTPALFVTLPTGNPRISPPETALQPMLLFAKGMGDLPNDGSARWLRPFALQGDLGYLHSVDGAHDRQTIYDLVVEYSLPYLDQWVRYANAGYRVKETLRQGFRPGAILGDLFPFAEFNGTAAVQGTPGGNTIFIRPGVAYMGSYFQLSLAADFEASGPVHLHQAGSVVLLDFFLDDIFPALRWTPFGRR